MLYYSRHFIKGFECGASRQLESDKADILKGRWVGLREYCEHIKAVTGYVFVPSGIGNPSYCNQCWKSSKKKTPYCPNCGAKMESGNNKSDTLLVERENDD